MANQPIPVLQREESSPKMGATPDFTSTFSNLAESEGNLGAIGASVAQSASNKMAVQLGYEQGNTPTGDLAPPLTEFDKNFADSYEQQSHAVLSEQGEKLLANAHIEMSKANRMTPDLIAKTTQQLQVGLGKIAAQAPSGVQQKLKEQFDSSVLNMNTQYNEKMISQNREDQTNNLKNGVDLNIKNAIEFAKNGDMKGASAAAESAKQMAANGQANHYFTPEEARVIKETADQSLLNGQYSFLAMQALKDNKYDQFEKAYSENKPAGMTNEQYIATAQAFKTQVNFIQGLRSQDENLKAQNMLNDIAMNPGAITGAQWQEFESSVTPLKAAEVKFHYIQALKKSKAQDNGVDELIGNWSSPEVFANAKPELKDAAFNKSVEYAIQQSQMNGNPMTREAAQVQVAASAGGVVPVFTRQLKNQLHSGNAAQIESAALMIHSLDQMQAGKALTGLNDQDHALYTAYEARRDATDPQTAAHDATAAILNQDPEVQLANKQKWSNMIQVAAQGGYRPTIFALQKFGFSESSFINPSMAEVYGADILRKYQVNYQIMNGDDLSAQKMTQRYVDENYGDTGVNGGNFKTLHPLEKVAGFQNHDGVPYIQQDVVDQLTPRLASMKKLYNDKKSDEYWEVLPLSHQTHGIFTTTYDPIQLKRTMRTAQGVKSETYPVVLQGNAFDNWDVAIQTDSGMRNLFQVAPFLGVMAYLPNVKAIREKYNKDHPLK